MKYDYKCPKKTNQRKWFKRTLKRSERAKAQEEVKSQVNEVYVMTNWIDMNQVQTR